MNVVVLAVIANALVAAFASAEECSEELGDKLIWEYHVRRFYMIGAYQEAEAEYGPSNVVITCINIDPILDKDNGSVWISAGGVGYNYVRVKFRSNFSRGFRYRVLVYGKSLTEKP